LRKLEHENVAFNFKMESGVGVLGNGLKRELNRQSVFASSTALLVGIGLAAGVLCAQSAVSKGRLGGTEPDDPGCSSQTMAGKQVADWRRPENRKAHRV
jgi:hypothetical protein